MNQPTSCLTQAKLDALYKELAGDPWPAYEFDKEALASIKKALALDTARRVKRKKKTPPRPS